MKGKQTDLVHALPSASLDSAADHIDTTRLTLRAKDDYSNQKNHSLQKSTRRHHSYLHDPRHLLLGDELLELTLLFIVQYSRI